uniref:uncharacterized protein n=1 Tax=Semicossyphus pulcher TaxID=241346 RepID=UPI0037E8F46F
MPVENGSSRLIDRLTCHHSRPQLSVDRQEVTGFIGEDVTVHCHYSVGGESRWCRLGGSCVKEPSGSIDGTTVTINVKVSKVFSVTLSGLRTQSSGWYFCDKGDLQMPVHVTVQERLSTTALAATRGSNTFESTHQPVNHTSVFEYEEHTTVQAASHSVSFHLKSFSVRLSVLILVVLVGLFVWFIFKRRKRTTAQTSAATPPEEEVTYSNVETMRETSGQRSYAESDVDGM